MRVLIINTSEREGGAAVAAGRLMAALQKSGVEVKMAVRDKSTCNPDVLAVSNPILMRWRFLWERIVVWLANRFSKRHLFSVDVADAGVDLTSLPEFKQADVIHLHWVNQGMLSLRDIRKILDAGKPVVWTLHDLWPCTGICHYPGQCTHFKEECHHCLYLRDGGGADDLSRRVFRRKAKIYVGRPIHFVACSRWLGDMARQSALCRQQLVSSIPNPIDVSLFAPADKAAARRRCGFPTDRKILLFGSVKISDERKGFAYLAEALEILLRTSPQIKDEWAVVLMGKRPPELDGRLPVAFYTTGYIDDAARLTAIYNAADLFVIPSLEDNLPNTVMEAMACGVPCVGFDTGGIPEMIDHGRNGYVARYRSAEDFACGIYTLLYDVDYPAFSQAARDKVLSAYAPEVVADRYMALYREEIERRRSRS